MLGEKPIWEVSYGGAVALAAVMLAGLSRYRSLRFGAPPDLHGPHHCAACDSGRGGKSDGANRRGIRHLRRLAEGAHGGALLDG